MSETLRWWFLLVVIGTLLLPLCLAVFRRLPDRGYALSKPFGLLLLGYVFWLLNSFHILPNDPRGILASLVPLIALSALFAYREWDDLVEWIREHWHYIAAVEALFFIAFITAVWLRSTVGEITGTEQPMDLMFLNAARQADNFPPKDPWLSGETVAYYWFGYMLVAMMSHLASVPGDVAYNIGLGMIAAMAFVGASGIVYSLVFMRESAMPAEDRPKQEPRPKENKSRRRRQAVDAADASEPAGPSFSLDLSAISWKPYVFGFAGGLILVVMGNFVFAVHFFSSYIGGGCGFYEWLDVSGLTCNEPRATWYPSEFFSFFDTTRIFPVDDGGFRVITEFPMFSFILGDLHPHVMALPFVLLVVGLALSLYRTEEPIDITFWLQRPLLLLAAGLLLGGLTFINTWDIATLSMIVIVTVFVSNWGRTRAITGDLFVQTISFGVPLVALAFLLYLPFLFSIFGNSQANGISAVVSNDFVKAPATRPVHMLLYWLPLFVLVIPFVLSRVLPARSKVTQRVILVSIAPSLALVAGWFFVFLIQKASFLQDLPLIGSTLFPAENLGTGSGNVFEQFVDRGSGWITFLFLTAGLSLTLVAIWLERLADDEENERKIILFVLTLIASALFLILACEFFFVGDVFTARMNTVFKVYYQAWLLLAVSGGFSLYYLASTWRITFPQERTYKFLWAGAAAIVLAGAALYPLGGTMNRAEPYSQQQDPETGETTDVLTIVGGSLHGIGHYDPDELAGISWLNERAKGQSFVIAESLIDESGRNEYTYAARVSAATGLPQIIGWPGHEHQWRDGECTECFVRVEDSETLFSTTDPIQMLQILQKYEVDFIYVGPLEEAAYGGSGGLAKFRELPVAFQQGAVTIYRTP